jgi:thiamine-phosphate pyrophosphorylase
MTCALYLISPAEMPEPQHFVAVLEDALAGGTVAAFQLRLKNVPDKSIVEAARILKPVLASAGTAFIINDRADIAADVKADGVHLGQSDGDIAHARALLGADAQIGVTCHDSRHLAMEAGEAGADYVAFGAFYPTATKTVMHHPAPEILTWWSGLMEIPCVAIGGITLENASPLIQAGADFLAVSAGIWSHSDGPRSAVEQFNRLMLAAKTNPANSS